MEKKTTCEALMKFIQEHCQKCTDAHCFGPACVENTGRCPVLQKGTGKPADFGSPRIVPSL